MHFILKVNSFINNFLVFLNFLPLEITNICLRLSRICDGVTVCFRGIWLSKCKSDINLHDKFPTNIVNWPSASPRFTQESRKYLTTFQGLSLNNSWRVYCLLGTIPGTELWDMSKCRSSPTVLKQEIVAK